MTLLLLHLFRVFIRLVILDDYRDLAFPLTVGQEISRKDLVHQLIFIQYERNEVEKSIWYVSSAWQYD